MSSLRVLRTLAAAFLLLASGVVLANSASAVANLNFSTLYANGAQCTTAGSVTLRSAANGGGQAVTSVTGTVTSMQDALTVINECPVAVRIERSDGNWVQVNAGQQVAINPLNVVTSFVVKNSGNTLSLSSTVLVSVTLTQGGGGGGGGGGNTSPSGAGGVPAPLMQQFGMPSSGSCDAAAPATLNWADVASGGWSQSWAQWMNDGKGGAVCSRTLVYSVGDARWTVG